MPIPLSSTTESSSTRCALRGLAVRVPSLNLSESRCWFLDSAGTVDTCSPTIPLAPIGRSLGDGRQRQALRAIRMGASRSPLLLGVSCRSMGSNRDHLRSTPPSTSFLLDTRLRRLRAIGGDKTAEAAPTVDLHGTLRSVATLKERTRASGDRVSTPSWPRSCAPSRVLLVSVLQRDTNKPRDPTGIEALHHGHGHMMVAPTIHPEGRRYRWIKPDGTDAAAGEYPSVGDIPRLPGDWVSQIRKRSRTARDDLSGTGLSPAPPVSLSSETKRNESRGEGAGWGDWPGKRGLCGRCRRPGGPLNMCLHVRLEWLPRTRRMPLSRLVAKSYFNAALRNL